MHILWIFQITIDVNRALENFEGSKIFATIIDRKLKFEKQLFLNYLKFCFPLNFKQTIEISLKISL